MEKLFDRALNIIILVLVSILIGTIAFKAGNSGESQAERNLAFARDTMGPITRVLNTPCGQLEATITYYASCLESLEDEADITMECPAIRPASVYAAPNSVALAEALMRHLEERQMSALCSLAPDIEETGQIPEQAGGSWRELNDMLMEQSNSQESDTEDETDEPN